MSSNRWLLLVLVLALCGRTASANVTNCIDVTAYPGCTLPCSGKPGAQSNACACANDNADDQPAIMNAIKLAVAPGGSHAVCFPGGVFDVMTKTSGVSVNLGNPSGQVGGSPASNLQFSGVGVASVIKMNGSGGNAAWTLFQINNGAQHIAFRDLVLDGLSVTMAGTATTLLQIGTGDASAVQDITVDRVMLRNSPKNAVIVEGLSGSSTTSYVTIRSSRISANGVNGVTVYQGSQYVDVSNNYFDGNGLDIETLTVGSPSNPPIESLKIHSNIILRTGSTPVSMYLHGSDMYRNKDLSVAGNILTNGRMHISNWNNIALTHNLIAGGTQSTSDVELLLDRYADGVLIEGNIISRQSATAGFVMNALYNAVGAPGRMIVRDNMFVQSSLSNIVQFSSATNLSFSNNVVLFAPTTASTNVFFGVAVRTSLAATDFVQFSNNLFNGNAPPGSSSSLMTSIRFTPCASPCTFAINRISIAGNHTLACTNGVMFDSGGGAYTTVPVITDNIFEGATTDINNITLVPAVALGGNVGGAVVLEGKSGVPSISAPVGSLFQRGDGTGSAFYVREPGGWQPK